MYVLCLSMVCNRKTATMGSIFFFTMSIDYFFSLRTIHRKCEFCRFPLSLNDIYTFSCGTAVFYLYVIHIMSTLAWVLTQLHELWHGLALYRFNIRWNETKKNAYQMERKAEKKTARKKQNATTIKNNNDNSNSSTTREYCQRNIKQWEIRCMLFIKPRIKSITNTQQQQQSQQL